MNKLILAMVPFAACIAPSSEEGGAADAPKRQALALTAADECVGKPTGTPVNANVVGNILAADVGMNSCAQFEVCWTGDFLRQGGVRLYYQDVAPANGPQCRGYVNTRTYVDVSPIAELAQSTWDDMTGTVLFLGDEASQDAPFADYDFVKPTFEAEMASIVERLDAISQVWAPIDARARVSEAMIRDLLASDRYYEVDMLGFDAAAEFLAEKANVHALWQDVADLTMARLSDLQYAEVRDRSGNTSVFVVGKSPEGNLEGFRFSVK